MTISTVFDPHGSPAVLVDRMLGSSYEVVRYVAENLEQIRHLSNYMEKIYRVEASVENIDAVSGKLTEVNALFAKIAELVAVYNIRTSVTTVATNIVIITTIEQSLTQIQGLYDQLSKLVQLNANLSQLLAIHAQLSKLVAIHGELTKLVAIYDNLDRILEGKIFTQDEKDKLAAIAAEATKNQTDAYLLARANHTGTQPQASIDGLPAKITAYDTAVTELGTAKTDIGNLKTQTAKLAGDNVLAGFTQLGDTGVGVKHKYVTGVSPAKGATANVGLGLTADTTVDDILGVAVTIFGSDGVLYSPDGTTFIASINATKQLVVTLSSGAATAIAAQPVRVLITYKA